MKMADLLNEKSSNGNPSHHEDESLQEDDDLESLQEDDDLEWESVGELVNEPLDDEAEEYEDELEDVSDPPVLSDEMYPDLLDKLNEMSKSLEDSLDDVKFDEGPEECYRSRHHRCRPAPSLCPYPPYVVFRIFRFCCPSTQGQQISSRLRNPIISGHKHPIASRLKHPIVQRRRSLYRCF